MAGSSNQMGPTGIVSFRNFTGDSDATGGSCRDQSWNSGLWASSMEKTGLPKEPCGF